MQVDETNYQPSHFFAPRYYAIRHKTMPLGTPSSQKVLDTRRPEPGGHAKPFHDSWLMSASICERLAVTVMILNVFNSSLAGPSILSKTARGSCSAQKN